jgi:hypothetical protein
VYEMPDPPVREDESGGQLLSPPLKKLERTCYQHTGGVRVKIRWATVRTIDVTRHATGATLVREFLQTPSKATPGTN